MFSISLRKCLQMFSTDSAAKLAASTLEIKSNLGCSALGSLHGGGGRQQSSCASPPTGSELVRLELDWVMQLCGLEVFLLYFWRWESLFCFVVLGGVISYSIICIKLVVTETMLG